MNHKIQILAGLACAFALTSCGAKDGNREETIQRAIEIISNHSDYNEDEGELLIYEKNESDLGLVTIHLEPHDPEGQTIGVNTMISFNNKYNNYVNNAQMAIDLYAQTNYRYNLTFVMKSFYDYENDAFPFMYSTSARVGEDYVKGSNKYQLLDESYKNENGCPLTKKDSQNLFEHILILSFEATKDFFTENNLDFSVLYPNY